ncbi:hypothetical protein ABD91_21105 [Lysinibacillus sphaericus]|uniref:hypothetical protein n=1 Tax=Lysinibacillus sphaericus TaxID=1421 RepID=UPI0018CD977E|nr:hypothetical protein [Lysinibacillus sphaericus]MBG9693240.1 hypothetical protein [Lysinibacillus sphaericus]
MEQDLSNEQIAQVLRVTLQESVQQGSAEGEKVTFTLLEDNAVNMGVIFNQQTKGPAGVVIADPSNDKVAILEIQSVLEVVKFATPVLVASEMLLDADGSLASFTESEKIVLEAAQGLSKRLEGLGVYRPSRTQKKKEDSAHASTN